MTQYVFQVGEQVERAIDEVWYPAKITAVDPATLLYSIEYLDDGNTEDNVSRDEIRGVIKRLGKARANEHPLLGVERDAVAGQCGGQAEKKGKPGPEWQTPLQPEKLQKIREVLGNRSRPVISDTTSEDNYRITRRGARRPRRRHSLDSLRSVDKLGVRPIAFHPWAGVCEQCEKMTVYRCSRCAVTYYCDRACQRRHYKHHADNCKLSAKTLKPLYKLTGLPTDAELLANLGSATTGAATVGSTPAKPGTNKKNFIPLGPEPRSVTFAETEEPERSRKSNRDGTRRDDEGQEMQELSSMTGKRSKPFNSEYDDDPMAELERGMKRLHVSGGGASAQPDFLTGDVGSSGAGGGALAADETLVGFVCDMLAGTVSAHQAREALELFRNNVDRAVDYLLTGPRVEDEGPRGKRTYFDDDSSASQPQRQKTFSSSTTASSPAPAPAPSPAPAPAPARAPTPAPSTASGTEGLLLFTGQHFIEKRPCNVTIRQRSSNDFTMDIEILVLDAEHGEDPHTHNINVPQADFLSMIRVHEPHPQDILTDGNEHERANTVLKYLGGQITTQDGKDLLHYVVCTPAGRVIGLSAVPEDVTTKRNKFSYGPPPNPDAPLLGTSTVDEAVVDMLVEMLGVDRAKAHVAAAMHDNDADRAANYLLANM